MISRANRFILLSALAATTVLASGPARAQLDPLTDPMPRTLDERSDKRLDRVEQSLREMRAILYQGRDTGKAVVVQPAETSGQIDALTNRVNDLESTLRRLNGQIDQVSADIGAMRKENTATVSAQQAANAQNAQLTLRLDAIEKQLATLVGAHNDQQAQAASDPAKAFDAAMQLYTDNQTRAAATAFQSYIDTFSDRPDIPEARYYLGESFFKQADYANAAPAYIGAIRGWPQTPWAPDAVIKLSMSLIELDKNSDACGILKEFPSHYPKATAGQKAQAGSTRTRARCG
jgi:tol-pal system protein YbgF